MDRKEFLKNAGVAAGSLAFLGAPCSCLAGTFTSDPPVTPCEKKQEFAQIWMKRFFDALDQNVDEETRKKLMHANGSACYRGSLGGETVKPMPVDDWIAAIQKYVGKENCRREKDAIYFNYVGNPEGLKVDDGYCLCPIVESGPPGLSGTYCECSIGYVTDMFEMHTGNKYHVELLESLKRGGKKCRFKITPA